MERVSVVFCLILTSTGLQAAPVNPLIVLVGPRAGGTAPPWVSVLGITIRPRQELPADILSGELETVLLAIKA